MKHFISVIIITLSIGIFLTTEFAFAQSLGRNSIQLTNTVNTTGEDINNDYVSFNLPLQQDYNHSNDMKTVEASSDEYWVKVTGAQLNQGFSVFTSQPQSLIRITRGINSKLISDSTYDPLKKRKKPKSRYLAKELDTSLLTLVDSKQINGIESIVAHNQLAATGVFENTLALKTSSSISGKLLLKTTQPLTDEDLYIVSVKEKNSGNQLSIELPKQSFLNGQTIHAIARMTAEGILQKSYVRQAYIEGPNGTKSPLSVTISSNGELKANIPLQSQVQPPIKGLYEIQLQTEASISGETVLRNVSLAFALSKPTARLLPISRSSTVNNSLVQNFEPHIHFVTTSSSRYEVRAELYGTDAKGDLIPVMESHAAQTFQPGKQQIKLQFDQNLITNKGVSAPFELRNIRLIDQKQLGLVDQKLTITN